MIQRLSAELLKILANPEVRKRIEDTGSITRPGSPEALGKLTMAEANHAPPVVSAVIMGYTAGVALVVSALLWHKRRQTRALGL